ncbi:MAG: helix-turn-helix domain-containing protein [Oscillospiraceae bacterium]|nr:helix-turn-helix domain-containing protein [Oscillospiraceae bacterium]
MKNLAFLRKKSGLTQMQFAKKIGVSTSTVAMWETGRRKPDYPTIMKICRFFGVEFEQLLGVAPAGRLPDEDIQIPVAGYVRGGQPAQARQEIIGYELVNSQLAAKGEIFALKVKGHSMEPKMSPGDVVIVRRTPVAENGQTVVAMVGREEATVKKIVFQKDGITLVPTNPDYMPMYYTARECESLPVTILGVVIELRCKYE